MNKVVEILMKRDHIDQDIAEARVKETKDEIIGLENILDADDIIREYLKIEPKYIFDILDMK